MAAGTQGATSTTNLKRLSLTNTISAMFIQDMLALTPTLTVMGLFMMYRDNILCMWACNPQMQTMMEVGKEFVQRNAVLAQRYMAQAIVMANSYLANLPEMTRSIVSREVMEMVRYRVASLNGATNGFYLYIVFTLACAVFVYSIISAENRAEEDMSHNTNNRNHTHVKVTSYVNRPITRSMSRQLLTESASSFGSSHTVF